MSRQNDVHDALPPAPPTSASPGAKRPEDIEQEIGAIRARMDSVIDEIEFRLSPGQMGGGVMEVVREVIQGGGGDGMPGRIARAVRANPVPVALIGIGALWLGWAVARTPESATGFDDLKSRDGTLDPQVRLHLGDLVIASRDGALALRRADMAIADPALSARFEALADRLERSAATLEGELRRGGGWIDSDGAAHGVWAGVGGLTTAGAVVAGTAARGDLLARLETGLDDTLGLFRDTLREALPEHLQVAVGAEFHAIETARHRVGALRAAMA